jgi:amino acid adenylation domain-containing protein
MRDLTETSPKVLTLVDLLRSRAESQPDHLAYTFLLDGEQQELSLTYSELDRQARAIAAQLQTLVSPGSRVLLLYPPGLEYIAAFFGCLYAGAVAVPAYPPRRNRNLLRLQALVADAQASVALTTAPVLARINPLFSQNPYLEPLRWLTSDSITAGIERYWEEPAVNSESLAFLQYTSGSTSTPKGVMLTHGNLLHNQRIIQHAFQQTEESVILGWLPLYHDMGLIGNVIQPLYVGARCILMSPTAFLQKPLRWLEAIARYRATTSGGPNFAFDLCARKITEEQRATLDLSSWTVAFNGSEPVRAETMERFAETFAMCGFRREAFAPCYGLAEATLIVTGPSGSSSPVVKTVDVKALEKNLVVEAAETAETKAMVGCGVVGMDQQLIIVDPDSERICPPDQVGEIWISGPSVAAGYWNHSEETERIFQARLSGSDDGRFLRTGDLGFLQDGELYVTGRLKDLIIIRGFNHYPQDIELTASQCSPALRPGCGAAFAIEVDGEEKLVVIHEVDHRRQANLSEVIEQIIEAVAEVHELQVYAVSLIRPGSLPKTSSGKIQRHACRLAFLERSLEVVVEWRSESEVAGEGVETVAGVSTDTTAGMVDWLKAALATKLRLNPSAIDVNKPVARYGLDSLLAIELVHQAETALNIALPLTFFLQDLNITQLAAQMVDQRLATSSARAKLELSHETITAQPLSHGQKALWFLHQMAPESAAYNIVGAVRVRSELDVAALKRAFQALVDRHPSLRTTFVNIDGEPVQSVHENVEVFFEEEDADDWSEEMLRQRLSERAHLPFDLQDGPVLRATLFHRQVDEHVLLLSVHHIVSDIWSLAVLIREVGVLYSAECAGTPVTFAALPLQFSDIVRWEHELLQGPAGERLWRYWQKQLAGELPVLDLPIDHPRPSVQTYRGASIPFRLDPELTRRLKVLSQENGATLYMTLLAAFQTLLARYTGQTDILVGSPAANRNLLETAAVIGYFVNPVTLRGDLSGDPTFENFLGQIRRVALEAFDHQGCPLPLLVERLRPVRDPSYSPLFQVLFVLQNTHLGDDDALAALALGEEGVQLKLGDLKVESFALDQRVAQFDLTMMLAESEDGLAASLQYNTDLFESATIRRMIGHFQTLLEGIVDDPTQRLSQLPLLTDRERSLILCDWNQSATPYAEDLLLNQLVEEQVRRFPKAIALTFGNTALSYAELDIRANRLAHYLQKLGVSPETRVGVCFERSVELVVALLAVIKAGGAYVPLDPSYPGERLAFMLHDAECSVLLTSHTLAETLPDHQAKVVRLDDDWAVISEESATQPQSRATPFNAAYVIYTSGSTGQPKGVINTHRGICNRLLWMQDAYNLTAADSVLQKTPFSFDVSVWEFFWPLMTGARLVLAVPGGHKDPPYLVHLIQEQQITVMHFVPAMLQVFLDEPEVEHCTSLRLVVCSGEALSNEHQEKFFARLTAALHNLYGPTEAAVDVTYWACERASETEARAGVPIGRPIANTEIYLLDEHRQAVPVGVAGELHIGGVGLARGYLNRPELTAEKFIPHPFSKAPGERLYRTGDLARYRAGGEIEYLGRLDHQVKLRGFRIELGELEAVLGRHESVREAVVIVREDGAGDEKQLVAYVTSSGDRHATPAELSSYMSECMPDYMVPAKFVVLEKLPLTANGKVDRKALPKPERKRDDELQSAARPVTEVEEVLCGIWSTVLKVEHIAIDDNFFELGGHSLLAVQLRSRIREAFDTDLELPTLFEFPTVAGMAARIQSAMLDKPGLRSARMTRVDRDRDLPLSFAQQRLWFLDQLEPGSSFYNSPAALRLSGDLDIDALRRTFHEIICRHEVLRTIFAMRDGQAVQHIHAPTDFQLPVRDLTHLTGEERESEALRLTHEEAHRPFDLSRGPLMRATLLKLGEQEHILLLTMHHIVSDGWSVGILIREVAALYDAFTRGAESSLPELAIQYADYAVWQREWLTSEVLNHQLSYWRTQLSGPLPVLALPTDYPRPAVPSYRGAMLTHRLSPELSASVRELGRSHHATLYMTLLAVFETLLYRETGAEEILVGSAVANRNHEETERLIGFFVNMLVMRADLSRQLTFAELLGQVRQVALGAYAHQDVPFEKLVEEFGGKRKASQAPLFQVAFGVNNTPQEEIRIGTLRTKLLAIENETGRYDLTLWVEEEEALKATWYYNTDLFTEERIKRLAGRFEKLIESAIADPQARLSALDILTDEEKKQQVMEEQELLESNVRMLKTARRKSPSQRLAQA